MGLVLKHVEQTRSGSWQYRRRVPKDVSEVIPKREFKRKLGDSQREALAAYPQYHAQVERVIEAAKKRMAGAVAASGRSGGAWRDRGSLGNRCRFSGRELPARGL
ncbi:DUF6538 domain-containing protein [Rhodobacter capsulatus]|uniref:DUF6538 domain-containing protein n=1 Tax=Rhodobacter capsulatus TaxID=1061 RepID=UPI00373FCCD8